MSLPDSGYTPQTVSVNVYAENPDTLATDGAVAEISFWHGVTDASGPVVQAVAAAIAAALTEAYPGWKVTQSATTTGLSPVQLS